MSFIGGLVSAGASVIGSIFGNKPKKTTSSVNYVQMVRNAEAAGFNPLTALRNGGAAGFTTTTTPALSSAEVLSDVGNKVGQFLQDFDPMADDKREAEYALVQAQIANLNASTDALRRPMSRAQSFNVPSYTAGQTERRPSAVAGRLSSTDARPQYPTKALPAAAGVSQTPEVKQAGVTNPSRTGNDWWHVDPVQPDASAWEERYGEPGDWIGGAFNGATDVLYNAPRIEKKLREKYPVLNETPKETWDRLGPFPRMGF